MLTRAGESGSARMMKILQWTKGLSRRSAIALCDGERNFLGELSPCPGDAQIPFFDDRVRAERKFLGLKRLLDAFPAAVFQSGVRCL